MGPLPTMHASDRISRIVILSKMHSLGCGVQFMELRVYSNYTKCRNCLPNFCNILTRASILACNMTYNISNSCEILCEHMLKKDGYEFQQCAVRSIHPSIQCGPGVKIYKVLPELHAFWGPGPLPSSHLFATCTEVLLELLWTQICSKTWTIHSEMHDLI
jgi:hypothetical protein